VLVLIAYNYDSAEEFVFENPAYSINGSLKSELIAIPRCLKLALDMNLG
jgi:hypothetical protein